MRRSANIVLLLLLGLGPGALWCLPGCDQTPPPVREMTLHEASARGHVETAQRLLDAGADVNAKDERGSTPLHLAVRRGYTGTVALLLERGAELNLTDADGRTALEWADALGHTETAELLRSRGEVE